MNGTDRDLLLALYRNALEAVNPGRALLAALDARDVAAADRTWILALGKAAHSLAEAAVAWLGERGLAPAGGLVIAPDPGPAPHPALAVRTGDHPLPGDASAAAAEALEDVVRQVQPRDEVWVLLSGGTSSLIAAPVRGIAPAELRRIYELLLGSGLDIAAMNKVRKRVSRWAAGRLAVALAHANVDVFIVSDVIGDDVATIASGPCSPDPSTAVTVRALLDEAGLLQEMPSSLIDLLDRTERRMVPETPKANDAAFRSVRTAVISSNRVALEGVALAAERLGLRVRVRRKPLRGEAAALGAALIRRFVRDAAEAAAAGVNDDGASEPICYLAGGETTVTLGDEAGKGGRCQELALAAACVLERADKSVITLLAAGTDGRDGPTDAAGAIVDRETCARVRAAGRDPLADLERHDAYTALDAAGALIRTGPTGTNVMDLVMALVHPA